MYRNNLELFVCERIKQLEYMTLQLAESRNAVIMGMSLMSDIHDKITGDHIQRIKTFTQTGRLTQEEFDSMKSHTLEGADILRQTEKFFNDEKDEAMLTPEELSIAKNHTVEGADILRKTEHFLSAGIVAIADMYDALKSPRQYKNAFTHEETVDIILKGDGRTSPTHFDPHVLEVFKAVQADFRKIC